MRYFTLLISLLVLTLTSCQKEKKRIESVYDDPAYSIGTILSSTSRPLKATYTYEYAVESGRVHRGEYIARGVGQDDLSIISDRFLVVYKQSESEESHLNTNYPIESDQDFLDLLVEFEDAPPSP